MKLKIFFHLAILFSLGFIFSSCLGTDDTAKNNGDSAKNLLCAVLPFTLTKGESGTFQVNHSGAVHIVSLEVTATDTNNYYLTEILDGKRRELTIPYSNCDASLKDLSRESLLVLADFPQDLFIGYPFCDSSTTASTNQNGTVSCEALLAHQGSSNESNTNFFGDSILTIKSETNFTFKQKQVAAEEYLNAKVRRSDISNLSKMIAHTLYDPTKSRASGAAIIVQVIRMTPLSEEILKGF